MRYRSPQRFPPSYLLIPLQHNNMSQRKWTPLTTTIFKTYVKTMSDPTPTTHSREWCHPKPKLDIRVGELLYTVIVTAEARACGKPPAGLDTFALWADPGPGRGANHGTWQTAAFFHRSSEKALPIQRQVITTEAHPAMVAGQWTHACFVHSRTSWETISVLLTETNNPCVTLPVRLSAC